MTKNMNDKTAIDAMEKAKKIVRKFPQIEQAVLAPMLTLEIARALLSEAEGERERLQTQIDDIADELGCTEKTSHRHSHGRCIFAAIENLRTELQRWKEKAELHGLKIQQRITNAYRQAKQEDELLIVEAREAGRREGDHKRDAAYTAYFRLKRLLNFLDRLGGLGLDVHDYIRLELSQTEADYQKALIDSPKAEGEETSDNYVAWLQFRKGSIRVCDSDAGGAFRVYRHPKEAEGEEPSDDYVAWLQFRQRSYRVCDSDAGGAFRVYRHPKEAEGEAAASRHGFHAACGTFHDLSICHVGAPAEAEGDEPK